MSIRSPKRWITCLTLAGAVLVTGCGAGESTTLAAPTVVGDAAIDPPASVENAMPTPPETVALAVVGDEFESVTVLIDERWEVEATVPRGWEIEEDFLGRQEAGLRDAAGAMAPYDDVSSFTKMLFAVDCGGGCAPTDWEERLNGPNGRLTQRRATFDLVRDEPIADGWVQVATEGDDLTALVARWDDEASHYFTCELEIDDDDAELVDDLIAACATSAPRWFPA